jgi:hypothetical protein
MKILSRLVCKYTNEFGYYFSPTTPAVSLMAFAWCLLVGTPALLPPSGVHYSPPIANTIQKWGVSTLREQIQLQHVAKVAFYADSRSVEVLDINGLQRRVEIFPDVAPMLVDDLHAAHVPFFVAPAPEPFAPALVAFARAFVLMLVVLALIDALGLMDQFLWGVMLVGAGWMHILSQLAALLEEALDSASAYTADGKRRHDESLAALLAAIGLTGGQSRGEAIRVRVDEDEVQ